MVSRIPPTPRHFLNCLGELQCLSEGWINRHPSMCSHCEGKRSKMSVCLVFFLVEDKQIKEEERRDLLTEHDYMYRSLAISMHFFRKRIVLVV